MTDPHHTELGNAVEARLRWAVTPSASFDAEAVGARVRSRRRRRRAAVGGGLAAVLGIVVAVLAWQVGDDGGGDDVDVVGQPESAPPPSVPPVEQETVGMPAWGWIVPDLDGDARPDRVDGETGAVVLDTGPGPVALLDPDGGPVTVPVAGEVVFTCNLEFPPSLELQWDDAAGDAGIARRLSRLLVEGGAGVWQASPSFFFPDDGPALPARGQGCERFGEHPPPSPVADGPMLDDHVEATDMVFPECGNPLDIRELPPDRRAELDAIRAGLEADGLFELPFFSSSSISTGDGRIQIGLYRRYGPTVQWLAERVAVDDLCWFILPPVGAFTGEPGFLEWEVIGDPGPDATTVTVRNAARCGVIYPDLLLPPQVRELSDRVEVMVPLRPRYGPSISPCPPPDEFEITLGEPLGDRAIVAPEQPATIRLVGADADTGLGPVIAGETFAVGFDPAGLGDDTTMGDEVMVQSFADPAVQIQVTGVFTDDPRAGAPEPLVADRWEPTGTATVVVPADTPAGEYTIMFIEHPQFFGRVTVSAP